ncbi:MAG: cupin domain-containing protein [Candidatus Brockarchaeota archaeon]|nr:cupin domain-containing protein [Candidatus Brockarchaeota archaeon]
MWRLFRPEDKAFEPYGKGTAEIKRVMRQRVEEGRFEGFGLLRIPPRGEFPRHNHPERDEVYFVTSGSGTLLVGGEEVPLSEGCVVYVSGEEPHGLSNRSDEPLVVFYATAFA